ncbi:hypothetical protein [Alkaliphilus transvaalensis]|uniref:hypothetical protein n=1 Tax=Alkaliphilus transvaalensis TaxID=114628 RepID=UPI00047EB091|nr:hypothetical protein [Alkaliphilus transvaalensis]
MKKIIISICSFLIILLTIFSTYSFFESEAVIRTFITYTSPQYRLTSQLLENYYSEDGPLQQKAEKEIISITLKGLNLEKWNEYIDYIQLQVYEDQVLPNSKSQLIIALNLSKDLAVIGVYDFIGDHYVFHSKIDQLTPINKINLYQVSSLDHKALFINQTIDEKFGGFFYEDFIEVYYYLSGDFKKVWHKTIYFEEIYKETWIQPQGNDNLWNRVIEETMIEFIKNENDPFKLATATSLKKYTSITPKTPAIGDFTLANSETHNDIYYWSERYQTFILGEISQDVFLSDAALLLDLSKGRESLYGIPNQNFKLLTSKGELIYLPKKEFSGMFQFIFEE